MILKKFVNLKTLAVPCYKKTLLLFGSKEDDLDELSEGLW